MASRASIGGHPLHPILIPFPIGLLVFSVVADLIYLWRGNPVWHDYIAFYTLLAGIIGAGLAAIPGLIDWSTLTDPKVVKIANWHARVIITTVLIFVASFVFRTSAGATWTTEYPMLPTVLSIVGLLGLGIAGWLGGELVFKHRVAVSSSSEAETPSPRSHVRAA